MGFLNDGCFGIETGRMSGLEIRRPSDGFGYLHLIFKTYFALTFHGFFFYKSFINPILNMSSTVEVEARLLYI